MAFFNNAIIASHWEGFSLIYDSPKTSGMAHVFYIGVNPVTHLEDTLLVRSFPIQAGKDTLFFATTQKQLVNTVVVRTEDVRGFRAKEKVWENVESYTIEQASLTASNLLDPQGIVHVSELGKVGPQYLFDGETKGLMALQTDYVNSRTYYTFLAGPNAVGKPLIIELAEPKIPASMRFYGMLRINTTWPNTGELGSVWNSFYMTKVPCDVSVYASNNKDDAASWLPIGRFFQSRTLPLADRWARRTQENRLFTVDQLNAADPCYFSIEFFATPTRYKYIKFVVDEVFANHTSGDQNIDRWFTIHEVELYIKKD